MNVCMQFIILPSLSFHFSVLIPVSVSEHLTEQRKSSKVTSRYDLPQATSGNTLLSLYRLWLSFCYGSRLSDHVKVIRNVSKRIKTNFFITRFILVFWN